MTDGRLLTRAMLRTFLGNMAWSEVCIRMEHGQIPGPFWNVKADDKIARKIRKETQEIPLFF
jgi:hypothetical protein